MVARIGIGGCPHSLGGVRVPELPEVETVKRGLSRHLLANRVISVECRRDGLRFPFPKDMAASIEGRNIKELERRAKYLLIHLEGELTWICHLGMSGRFTIHEDGQPPQGMFEKGGDGRGKHDHVVFEMEDGCYVVYTDHRRFGVMDIAVTGKVSEHKLLRNIGPEPLSESFDGSFLRKVLEKRNSPIKTALLDQRVVAGLGNIYVCEALHISGISPKRKASRISLQRYVDLVAAVKEVLFASIEVGGSTLQDFAGVDGDLGYFPASFRVYGREGEDCIVEDCRGIIARFEQSGRSTFHCPVCQR